MAANQGELELREPDVEQQREELAAMFAPLVGVNHHFSIGRRNLQEV
jgi:hypothetical protein